MPAWVMVVFLVVSNVALHAAVRAVFPGAAVRWSTGWILTWTAWLVVVVPGTLIAWSNFNDAAQRKKLRARLDAWKAAAPRLPLPEGQRADQPVGALALALVEAEQHVMLGELLELLEPRRGASPELAAFLDACRKFTAAATHGSGAFHGDGWASLGLMEARDAAKAAARALP